MFKPTGNRQKQRTPFGVAFDAADDTVVVAAIAPGGALSITRVDAAERAGLNHDADVRTPLRGWSAHTDTSRLPVSAAADDEEILGRIIEGAAGRGGTAELRYTFGRTNDGRVVLTQALKTDVEDTLHFAGGWAARQLGRHAPVSTDTPTRCLARLWLSGPVVRGELPGETTVAFLVIGDDGYGTALWSKGTGLVYETSERFKQGAAEGQLAAHVQNKITNFVSPDTIGKLNSVRQSSGQATPLGPVSHLVISCCPRLAEAVSSSFGSAPQLSRLSVEGIKLAGGGPDADADLVTILALGAALDSPLLSAADLSRDLQGQIEAVRTAKREGEAAREGLHRKAAAAAIAAPMLAALVFFAACALWRLAARASLEMDLAREKAAAEQLKQENADFEAAKANFAVIKNLIGQIGNLRARQPDTYQLLAELNSRWPRGASSWYVSKVENVGNSLLVVGRTKDEQAITAFVSNLENSEGMFSGVTEDHKQQPQPPTPSAQPQQQPQAGVYEFTVKATYTPKRPTAPQQAAAQGAQH